ncbi:GNAT family N-acetyltransferase [Poseidonocella sp. HB161398]|uniref:GNAT family N-acetyltransferase n=1 Tax=Poseidonocella sp. HB161398 TaxID=2320855 RepID=UPI001109A959|nr:GNAT family N-acetyltransferase [Poseidonocella sp. HB161398]
MKLRPARPSDAPVLAAISIEVWLGTYIRRGVSPVFAEFALSEFTATRFAGLLADPDEHVTVSENEDGPDGFIRLSRGRPAPVPGCSDMEISTLYVQPRHHGRGLGRALLRAGLAHAREAGAPDVWLATNSENAPAIGFYLRQGFERVGTTAFRIGGEAYPNDVFRYPLIRKAGR